MSGTHASAACPNTFSALLSRGDRPYMNRFDVKVVQPLGSSDGAPSGCHARVVMMTRLKLVSSGDGPASPPSVETARAFSVPVVLSLMHLLGDRPGQGRAALDPAWGRRCPPGRRDRRRAVRCTAGTAPRRTASRRGSGGSTRCLREYRGAVSRPGIAATY